MLILDEGQRLYLESKARFTFIKVKENINQKEERPVGIICEALQEVASMGHSIAMDEVRSTPWEYMTLYASTYTDEKLNAASAEGWEFLCPFDGGKVLFRRRKAVAEIAAKEKQD